MGGVKTMLTILIILILSTIPLYSQENGVILLNQFTGGLNTRLDSGIINSQESPDCYNVVFDDNYTLQARKGSELKSTLPVSGTILSDYQFKQANGKRWYVVQVDSSIFATESIDSNTKWIPIILDRISTFYPCNYATYGDRLWITNGINEVFTFNGSTITFLNFIPKGRYIAVDNDILWIAGVAGSPSTLYFSEANVDPYTLNAWLSSNSIDINEDDGDIVTGLIIYQGRKLIFKKYGIYMVTGNTLDDIFPRNYSMGYGCIDNKSIQIYKNLVFFLSTDGIRSFNGSLTELVSEKVYNELRDINQISSGGLFEWRINKTVDFVQGTAENTQVIGNAIKLSSITYSWDTDAKFQSGTSSNVQTQDGIIRLSSTTAFVEEKVSLVSWNWEQGVAGSLFSTPNRFNYAYDNDSDSVTWCNINLKVNYEQYWKSLYTGAGLGYLNWRIKDGNDELKIIGKCGTLKNITKFEWDYTLPNGLYDNNLEKSWINIKYRDASNNNYYTINPNTKLTSYSREFRKDLLMPTDSVWHDAISRGFDSLFSSYYVNSYQKSYTINAYTDEIVITMFITPFKLNNASFDMNLADLRVYENTATDLYKTTGTYISPSYNTLYPTPRWGIFDCIISTPVGTSAIIGIETSADGSNWSIAKEILPGQNMTDIGIASQQYLRWSTTFYSPAADISPTILRVTINAVKSIGTYTSQVYDTRLVDNWHIFSVDDSTNNIVYYVRGGNTSANILNHPFVLQPKNTTLLIGTTNTYVQWKASMTTNNGGSNPTINGVGVGWFTGKPIKNVASCVYNNRYYLSVSTGNDSYNNVIYMFDNNGGFTKYDNLKPATLLVDNDNNIFYGAGNTNKYYQLESSTSDAGVPISTLWTSKDFDFSDYPIRINRISITGKINQSTGTITLSYSQGYEENWKNITVYLSSNSYSTEVFNIEDEIPTYNVKFKISSDVNYFGYDIRKIAIYYGRLKELNVGKQ